MKAANLQCYFEYVYNDISRYRQLVFEKLISNITGGIVADIGCGSVGWYWALGYMHRVESVSFIDLNRDYLDQLQVTMEKINPQWAYENIQSTLSYIDKIGGNIESACAAIHIKPINCTAMSIADIRVENTYDYVLAIESLEIVQTQEEFIQNLQAIFFSLKPGGTLLFSILPYDRAIDSVVEAQQANLEGLLNPDHFMIRDCVKIVGFNILLLESIDIPEKNYSTAIFGKLVKPML